MDDTVKIKYPEHEAIPPVFFVGASAGGVKALVELAENLPKDFPCPLFFLLHRRKSSEQSKRNLFNDILASKSKLEVIVPSSGEIVKAGRIYVPPNDFHITIEDNFIHLSKQPNDVMWRPAINVLFMSGAREYRERAISVLLTGGLDDGVDGLVETTRCGGITIAQSPEDAYNPILPLNALLGDHPLYVLPLKDMPALFCELASFPFVENQREILINAAYAAKSEKEDLQKNQTLYGKDFLSRKNTD